MLRRRRSGPEVFRITGARQGLAEDVRGRERRYVVSMLVRTVAVLLTVLLWDVQRPLAVATLVLGATLPYVAVVIANAGRENTPSLPDSYLSTPPRQPLEPTENTEDPRERTTAEPGGRTIRQDPEEPERPEPGPKPDPKPGPAPGPGPGAERPEPGQEPSRSGGERPDRRV